MTSTIILNQPYYIYFNSLQRAKADPECSVDFTVSIIMRLIFPRAGIDHLSNHLLSDYDLISN